jgi:hypothetical protein
MTTWTLLLLIYFSPLDTQFLVEAKGFIEKADCQAAGREIARYYNERELDFEVDDWRCKMELGA